MTGESEGFGSEGFWVCRVYGSLGGFGRNSIGVSSDLVRGAGGGGGLGFEGLRFLASVWLLTFVGGWRS